MKTLVLVIGLNLFLCALQAFHSAFNHDEFQHVHIAWNLSRGEMLYRDFFEHHGPLYSLVNSSLWRLLEWKPVFETLFALRFLSLAIAISLLGTTFLLAREVFQSRRLALAATAILSGLYFFQDKATEIRPDGLQNLFWLTGLYFVFCRSERFRAKRFFAAGFAFALALFTNTKSIFGIVVFVLVFISFHFREREKAPWLKDLGALGAGVCTVFLLGSLYFWKLGILRQFLLLNYQTNIWLLRHAGFWTFPDDGWFFLGEQTVIVPLIFLAIVFGVRQWRRLSPDQRMFLSHAGLVTCGIFFGLYRQFTLLFLPLSAIAFAWALDVALARHRVSGLLLIAALLVNLEATALAHTPWNREAKQLGQKELTDFILEQTPREEPVGYLWNDCGGYMFNEDVQYFWMFEETLVPLFDHLHGTAVFGPAFGAVLEARKVRYLIGWSVDPHEKLPAATKSAIRQNYFNLRPCLWESNKSFENQTP